MEALITQFIDLKIDIESVEEPQPSEVILAQLDKVYAAQRKMKLAVQEQQRTQLARMQAGEPATSQEDAFPLEQLQNILADMEDVASQLDKQLIAREGGSNAQTSAMATAPTSTTPKSSPPSNKRTEHNAALPSPVPNKQTNGQTATTTENPLLDKQAERTDDWAGWGALEINPSEIRFDEERDFLGKGSFGRVYAGRCRGKEVAVKVPVKQQLSEKDLRAFRHEVLIMSKIFHPNVVLFMGASTQPGAFRIVSELLHTDLERLLRSDAALPMQDRARMAKDAALGMNWLHGISGIIHRDLKPANLLVDSNLTVKLTDFGFAQLRPEREDETLEDGRGGAKGTPLWMAPEIMMGRPFTEKVDIYSFGIILWQMLTRQEPFSHHRNLKLFRVAVCKRGERPPMPADAPPRLRGLIESCWDGEPARRPAFKEIVRQLDDVLIDAVIDDTNGADFWREHFSRSELQTSVPWGQFARVLKAVVYDNAEDLEDAHANPTDSVTNDEAGKELSFFKPLLTVNETQKAKGDKIVVTMERFSTNIKWFGRFYEVGSEHILEQVKVLQTKPWFHGDIAKDEAEARLSARMEGTFLVRLSATTPGCPFTISMINNQHRRILHEGPGQPYYAKGSTHPYNSLVELIETCRELSLLIPCPPDKLGWGYQQ